MSTREIYNTNKEFKEYVDKFMRNRKDSIDDVFKHQIIKDMAEYYKNKNKGVLENGR